MSLYQPIRTLFLTPTNDGSTTALQEYLQSTRDIVLDVGCDTNMLERLRRYDALVISQNIHLTPDAIDKVADFVHRGGACLGLLHPSANEATQTLFGIRLGCGGPHTEIRVAFADPSHPIARRMPALWFMQDQFQTMAFVDDEIQPVLTTMWQYERATLAAMRTLGDGRTACLTLQNSADPRLQQVIYRMLREATRRVEPQVLGVGVLGYGPISYAHGVAIQSVEGLEFRAIVDLNPQRRAQAQHDFPTVRVYQNAQELIDDTDVDVVVVATPPNTHARLTMDLLQAGKHVICEKPLCFTWQEAEQMLQAAETHQRLLSCHQNRRWDVDYLAIQQAIREGLIGEPFYLELFVGHYGHPCDYWHSHEPISGGTLYDWGAHYLDWALNLFPGQTASVVGTEHKRVWHDITNADQARAQVRFTDGREIEFTYSDIAAVRKPKWYLLGTEGAIVGHWNSIMVHQSDPVVFVREEEIPVTEATPHLTLSRRHPSGTMVEQQLVLPQPQRPAYHLNIANHLLTGEPLAVSAHSSARVVAVLEAAARSAKQGGTVEEVHV
ncbi:MAG: hypothetical protein GFH27_549331n104 [Chloroflexi bacterium AL-W]|nr:hypothetical protein [Chloroflexi bacterium AL-N1]NOK70404.1 hypothetical protein [Chloroflexi bacterium AL-N10]NOK78082.1 hypothetical protein [Chloroflexi bacterium AL-N5]NOK85181.1 hypothetical protein [Chloroflexi bacterium AL-W]NOK92170.1 hypothetical protein [Chloroflexi bacterium AL-N15]